MNKTLILNARIFTPGRPSFMGWLLAEDKKIADLGENDVPETLKISADEVIDAQGANLLPGFIDIHTHGCLGCCTGFRLYLCFRFRRNSGCIEFTV